MDGQSDNYHFSPKIHRVPLALKKSSSPSMATLSETPWWCTPIVSRWPPRGGLDSEFPSPRTPAHGTQGFSLSGRYAWQFGSLLLIGYSQLTYTCAYTCMHIYIYRLAHTYIQHIYRPYGYLRPADAPCRRCQLPAQTLKLRNHKSSLKYRMFTMCLSIPCWRFPKKYYFGTTCPCLAMELMEWNNGINVQYR